MSPTLRTRLKLGPKSEIIVCRCSINVKDILRPELEKKEGTAVAVVVVGFPLFMICLYLLVYLCRGSFGMALDSTFVVVSVLDQYSLDGRPRAVLLIPCLCMYTNSHWAFSGRSQRMLS